MLTVIVRLIEHFLICCFTSLDQYFKKVCCQFSWRHVVWGLWCVCVYIYIFFTGWSMVFDDSNLCYYIFCPQSL